MSRIFTIDMIIAGFMVLVLLSIPFSFWFVTRRKKDDKKDAK